MEEAIAYIESGKLELYVLGALQDHERDEVEAMANEFPAIKKEIAAIELAMEAYAQHYEIQPDDSLEDQIFEKINEVANGLLKLSPEATIIPLNPGKDNSRIKNLRIALVACVALLVVSVVALYGARRELNVAKQQITALNLDKQTFSRVVNDVKQSNEELKTIVDMPNDPDWKVVKLAGTKMDPQAKMVVYWHTSGQHVMVDNSKMGLPHNDEAHQYQLWALVDGKPVDLGVFDAKDDTVHMLVKMKEISSAQAFAVTLEKRGGAASPTMEQMIAMGAVSI